MKSKKIGITNARISGLTASPYRLAGKGIAWDIILFDTSILEVSNFPYVYLGKRRKEAKETYNQIKENFSQAGIHDGNKVSVIFRADGNVRAIGSIGLEYWIDVEDRFVKKTFKELDISISSLRVY